MNITTIVGDLVPPIGCLEMLSIVIPPECRRTPNGVQRSAPRRLPVPLYVRLLPGHLHGTSPGGIDRPRCRPGLPWAGMWRYRPFFPDAQPVTRVEAGTPMLLSKRRFPTAFS